MSLRIVVRTQDLGAASHVDGAVAEIEYRTFEIDAPVIEDFVTEPTRGNWAYTRRSIVGVEVTS